MNCPNPECKAPGVIEYVNKLNRVYMVECPKCGYKGHPSGQYPNGKKTRK